MARRELVLSSICNTFLFTQAPRVFGAYFYSGELQCARNRAVLRARLLTELSSGVTLQYTLPIRNHLTHAILTSTHVPHRPLLPPPPALFHRQRRAQPQPTHQHRYHRLHAPVQRLPLQDINTETRFAATAQAEGGIGVCFENYLAPGLSSFFMVGLWIDREYRCQDEDWTERDAHD